MAIQGAMSRPICTDVRLWDTVRSICLSQEWAWTMREGTLHATIPTGIKLSSTIYGDSALLVRLLRWLLVIGYQKSSTVRWGCAIDLLRALEFWGRGWRLWIRIAGRRWGAAGSWRSPVTPPNLSVANNKAHLGPLLWVWEAHGVDGLMRSGWWRGRVRQSGGGFVHSVAAAGLRATVIILGGAIAIDIRVIPHKKKKKKEAK